MKAFSVCLGAKGNEEPLITNYWEEDDEPEQSTDELESDEPEIDPVVQQTNKLYTFIRDQFQKLDESISVREKSMKRFCSKNGFDQIEANFDFEKFVENMKALSEFQEKLRSQTGNFSEICEKVLNSYNFKANLLNNNDSNVSQFAEALEQHNKNKETHDVTIENRSIGHQYKSLHQLLDENVQVLNCCLTTLGRTLDKRESSNVNWAYFDDALGSLQEIRDFLEERNLEFLAASNHFP